MTTKPRPGTDPDLSPLALALEHFAGILAIGKLQADECMALVSIAEDLHSAVEDLHRIAAHLTGTPPAGPPAAPSFPPYTISSCDISTGLRETGKVRYGTLGEAVDALREALKADYENIQMGLPPTYPRVEQNGRAVEFG